VNFLNPLVLWTLPIIALPLVLHLIHQKPPRHFIFSHIKWLKEAHQTLMLRKKLRDIIILLARTFLLLFLVFFFARPIINPGLSLSSKEGRDCLIVLFDVSASMGGIDNGRPILEIAREKTISLLREFPANSKVGLIAFSRKIEGEIAPTNERGRIISHIQELKVAPRPTDVLPALELAYQMLANQTASRKTILLVTDAAKHGWNWGISSDGKWSGYDPGVTVIVWEADRVLENSSISDVVLQLDEEGVLKGNFEENNYFLRNGTKNWQLILNGRTVDLGIIKNIRPEGEKVAIKSQLPEGGYYAGNLQLENDSFGFDDSYYVAGRIAKGFRLLIVEGQRSETPADSETYYLKLALDSPRDPRLKSIQIMPVENFRPDLLKEVDVLVLANVGNSEFIGEEVLDWVRKGGGLLISAGDTWNESQKAPLEAVRIGSLRRNFHSIREPKTDVNFFNQVTGLGDFEWKEARVQEYFPLENPSLLNPVLELDDGEPVLVSRKIGQGNVLVLLTTLDRAWTNLPSKPVFAPMFREIISFLSDPLSVQGNLMGFVDEPLSFKIAPGTSHITVVNPEGVSNGLRLEGTESIRWTETTQPGLYQVKTDGKDGSFNFGINIKNIKSEGNPARITAKELRKAFPKSPLNYVENGKNSQRLVLAALEGKDLTSLLIILIFACFVIETVLAWPRSKT